MFNFILCEKFYNSKQIEEIKSLYIQNGNQQKIKGKYGIEYGLKFIPRELEKDILNSTHKTVVVKKSESGIFRHPENCLIHFEEFVSFNEWCFVVAIQPTTFNLMHHKSGAKSALEDHNLNYKYFPDWDYHLNVLLQPGESVMFRPWLFHSLENGLIHYFKLIE